MIRNAFDMLFSPSRRWPAFAAQGRPPQAVASSGRPDPRWDDASVGMFICGMGRGLYAHPVVPGAAPAPPQGRCGKPDRDGDG